MAKDASVQNQTKREAVDLFGVDAKLSGVIRRMLENVEKLLRKTSKEKVHTNLSGVTCKNVRKCCKKI